MSFTADNFVQAAYTTESSVRRDDGGKIIGHNVVTGGRYRLINAQNGEQVRSAGSLGELFESRQRLNQEASGPSEKATFSKAWAQPRATKEEAQAEREARTAATPAPIRVYGDTKS